MLIVMSVKPTSTDKLLKVNSALKPIFSVIEDQCPGGTKFEMRKTALQNKLTLNNYSSNGRQTAEQLQLQSKWILL